MLKIIMEPRILKQRIESLTPEYLEFILSDFTDEAFKSIEAEGYKNFNSTVLQNGIFLYLSLFLHKYALIEFIITECNQSIEDAQKITDIVLKMMPPEMLGGQTNAALALEINNKPIKEKDRYSILDSSLIIKNRYFYAKFSNKVVVISNKHLGNSEEILESLQSIICDIALGFYKIEDTVPLLQQELKLDAGTAALLGADVLDFLAPLSDSNWRPPVEEVEISTEPVTHQTPVVNQSIPILEPIITPAETELPELRTMAADMAIERSPARSTFNAAASIDEPMYVSSQPTLTRTDSNVPSYTAPLYEAPKPNIEAQLEKPRWG